MHIYKADVCNSAGEMYARHNTFRNEAYIGRQETSTDERGNTINISVYGVVPTQNMDIALHNPAQPYPTTLYSSHCNGSSSSPPAVLDATTEPTPHSACTAGTKMKANYSHQSQISRNTAVVGGQRSSLVPTAVGVVMPHTCNTLHWQQPENSLVMGHRQSSELASTWCTDFRKVTSQNLSLKI